MSRKMIKGGGVWEQVAMPLMAVSADEANRLVEWIPSLHNRIERGHGLGGNPGSSNAPCRGAAAGGHFPRSSQLPAACHA